MDGLVGDVDDLHVRGRLCGLFGFFFLLFLFEFLVGGSLGVLRCLPSMFCR